MNKLVTFLVPTCIVMSLVMSCGQSGPSVTTTVDEVIVKAGELDVYFSRVRPFAQTYVLFGGSEMNHPNSFTRVILSGLDINTARSIHSMYPDFHECKSPGAPLAQREICDLEIVPADSKAMKNLKKSIAAHKKSLGKGENLACVRLEGEVLRLTSVFVRKVNEDITNQLPPQVHHEYYLVESAEVVPSREVLESGMR